MLEVQRSGQSRPSTPFHPAISISEDGLVCGAGSTLVRMSRAGGISRLLVEDDAARLVAMLSAAFRRRVSAAEIVPHVCAAAEHWARGDKAVANFRLTFARLPRLRDSADAGRLCLAEDVLDQGFSPDALMKELGFGAASFDLRRYREDEPRVPAGFGDQSGRWTNDPQFTPSRDKPTRVAEELPKEDEKEYETRHLEGATSRQEDIEHGRGGLLDTPGLPRGVGVGPYAGEPIPAGPGPRRQPHKSKKIRIVVIFTDATLAVPKTPVHSMGATSATTSRQRHFAMMTHRNSTILTARLVAADKAASCDSICKGDKNERFQLDHV